MQCEEVQQAIVESLAEPLPVERRVAMENHLVACETCRSFAETQRKLDARLVSAVPSARLSPGFQAALKKRIRRDPLSAWPDFLPDIAHLCGCVLAILLSAFVLPSYSATVILVGAAFTVGSYFLQAVIRSSLERVE